MFTEFVASEGLRAARAGVVLHLVIHSPEILNGGVKGVKNIEFLKVSRFTKVYVPRVCVNGPTTTPPCGKNHFY